MMGEFSAVLPFDTDEKEFRRGVEIGMLWAQTQLGVGLIQQIVHSDCAEMIIRLSESAGYSFGAEIIDEHFMNITLEGRARNV